MAGQHSVLCKGATSGLWSCPCCATNALGLSWWGKWHFLVCVWGNALLGYFPKGVGCLVPLKAGGSCAQPHPGRAEMSGGACAPILQEGGGCTESTGDGESPRLHQDRQVRVGWQAEGSAVPCDGEMALGALAQLPGCQLERMRQKSPPWCSLQRGGTGNGCSH